MSGTSEVQQPASLLASAPLRCLCCGGDGKETCDNPDHGFIGVIGGEVGRLGCPVCGHDENFKVPGGHACEVCDGSGTTTLAKALDYAGNEFQERVWHFEEPERIDWLIAAAQAFSGYRTASTEQGR